MKKTILITGVAGFIGYSLAKYMSENTNYNIVGIDNINNYYDIKLKHNRLKNLNRKVHFYERDIQDDLSDIFEKYKFDCIINLAAQAGVRYAKKNPDVYMESNIIGFYNILQQCQKSDIRKIIYASSSSVYGANKKLPFHEDDPVNTPMSIYAATKKSNEDLASGFFYSYGIRTIGLRFFNIYGPFGRPDMAYYDWVEKITNNEVIELRENGEMWRDMTYIDDCIECIYRLIQDEKGEDKPEIYNIGSRSPVKIKDMLDSIVAELGILPKTNVQPKGVEEPVKTWADTTNIKNKVGFEPNISYRVGLKNFVGWFKEFNK